MTTVDTEAIPCLVEGCLNPGPYDTVADLQEHARGHDPRPVVDVEPAGALRCPECGQPCKTNAGLGRHRSLAHGVRGARNGRPLPPALETLGDETGPTVTGRLARFATANVPPNGVIVIGDTYGPQVVARRYVADIVAQAGEPLLVLTLAQLVAKVEAR